MKAVICTAYGPPEVLEVRDVPTPVPRKGELLIRVHASSVTFGDCEIRSLALPLWTRIPLRLIMGYSRPRNYTPGMEVSGVVESVGSDVTLHKPGDVVFGSTGMRMGGNAEFICLSPKAIATKPSGVSHEQAVTIPVGGINALHFMRKANIQPGQQVLIIGGGGSIGTYGILLAKHYGAHVIAVDSAEKLDVMKAAGADEVIDYRRDYFAKLGRRFDVIFDLVYQSSFADCVRCINDGGVYLMANTSPLRMLRAIPASITTGKRFVFALAPDNRDNMAHIAALIAEKKIAPVIDKIFPLEKIVEAHSYVQQGRKKGCVVIKP